ncbi:MAG: solute carrier family 23 protein [Thalassobaculum sp.]|uniref:uracil-xanthine permease family protein n=1 Tax=Thalassobaculum sp. TaxID=2022740 RepID=UPI0032EBD5A3
MRPSQLTYALDDRPPLRVLLLSGLQHVAVITVIGMVFPLLVADRAGVAVETRQAIIGLSMLALGVTTLLQCLRWGPIGSGFLAPAVFTAAYLPASLKAAEQGGMPLVLGMTIFAGISGVVLSRVVHRLRPYLPAEIAGLAVLVIGIILGTLGFRLVFTNDAGLPHADPLLPRATVGLVVLAATAGLTIWGNGWLRQFAALLGFAAGCLMAAALGTLAFPPGATGSAGLLALPRPLGLVPSFDPALIPDFLVAALACALRAMGDITTCQKINDPEWRRQDMPSVQRGLLADGLGTVLAGLLGTVGTNTFSGSIGISVATGITARRVAWAIGGIFLAMSALPPVWRLLAAVPLEVAGGVLLFSACFIIISGVQVIMTRMLDARKTVLIGLSLILGLTYDLFPDLYAAMPATLRGIFGSNLVVALLTAILLNLLFRIGIARRATLTLSGGSDPDLPYTFMEEHGSEWGARREVIAKVTAALVEFREHADDLLAAGSDARVEVSYDEFAIEMEIRYAGAAPDLPDDGAPKPDHLMQLSPDEAAVRLRTLLLSRLADRVRTEQQGGEAVVRLHFTH